MTTPSIPNIYKKLFHFRIKAIFYNYKTDIHLIYNIDTKHIEFHNNVRLKN